MLKILHSINLAFLKDLYLFPAHSPHLMASDNLLSDMVITDFKHLCYFGTTFFGTKNPIISCSIKSLVWEPISRIKSQFQDGDIVKLEIAEPYFLLWELICRFMIKKI